MTICSCVVLPAPLTPTRPTRSPFLTSHVQFFSTWWFLKVIETCRGGLVVRRGVSDIWAALGWDGGDHVLSAALPALFSSAPLLRAHPLEAQARRDARRARLALLAADVVVADDDARRDRRRLLERRHGAAGRRGGAVDRRLGRRRLLGLLDLDGARGGDDAARVRPPERAAALRPACFFCVLCVGWGARCVHCCGRFHRCACAAAVRCAPLRCATKRSITLGPLHPAITPCRLCKLCNTITACIVPTHPTNAAGSGTSAALLLLLPTAAAAPTAARRGVAADAALPPPRTSPDAPSML